MKTNQRTVETPAPKASHEGSGWRRRGARSKRTATAMTARARPDRPAQDRPDGVEAVAPAGGLADLRARDEDDDGEEREQARRQQRASARCRTCAGTAGRARCRTAGSRRARPGPSRRAGDEGRRGRRPAPSRRTRARAALDPCRSASVRISPAAPGASASMIARTVRVTLSWSSAAAKPTSAISAGSSVSVNWNASAREWLKPSAARKRATASASSRPRPVRRSVSNASSPSSSSRVCGHGGGGAHGTRAVPEHAPR